ncbi:MAG: M20 family metallopeptidase [Candidatus Hodarchaeota archaeon]
MLENILDWIETNRKKFTEISDRIWSYAEVRWTEKKSSALLVKHLEEAGFDIQRDVADIPTAFIASYGTEKPVIGLLGEYDALAGLSQVTETKKKPVKEGDSGHGCGHNLLGTASFAAALAVKEAIDSGEVKGTIRFYGCPAEEGGSGKTFMVKAGFFADLDLAMTWHPGPFNRVASYNLLARYSVVFKFHGKAAHAASAYNGRSALDAVELMNIGVNYLREHIIPDARLHYVILKGGEAPNIVPAEAEVWYYVRAPDTRTVEEIYQRVLKIAEGAALMTETDVEVEFLTGSSNLLLNNVLEKVILEKMNFVGSPKFNEEEIKFAQKLRETFPPGSIKNLLATLPPELQELKEQLKDQIMCDRVIPPFLKGKVLPGSSDVGDVSWATPTAQFSTACCALGTPGHSWQLVAQAGMSIGHKGMLTAAKILALAAIEMMKKPELVELARQEFEEKIKKQPYIFPMPDGTKLPFARQEKDLERK